MCRCSPTRTSIDSTTTTVDNSLCLHLCIRFHLCSRFANINLQFSIDGADMHLTVWGNIAHEDAETERNSEKTLDHATQGTCALCLAEALLTEQVYRAIIGTQRPALLQETCG